MKIISTNVYVGPNVYANFPVIRHQIDIGELENWPSVKLGDNFINGLVSALFLSRRRGVFTSTQRRRRHLDWSYLGARCIRITTPSWFRRYIR